MKEETITETNKYCFETKLFTTKLPWDQIESSLVRKTVKFYQNNLFPLYGLTDWQMRKLRLPQQFMVENRLRIDRSCQSNWSDNIVDEAAKKDRRDCN